MSSLKERFRFSKDINKIDSGIPTHEYFHAHQCHLPDEEQNAFKIKSCRLRRIILGLTCVRMGDIRAQALYRSYAALQEEKYRQYKYYPLSIHPYSIFRVCVEAFFIVAMLISNTMLTFHFSQSHPDQEYRHYMIMYIFDILYLINVVVNFFTGYVEGNTWQYVVLDLKKIAFKYARTWLIVDVLSTACFLPGVIYIREVYPHLILISTKFLRMPILLVYINNVLTVIGAGILKKTLVQTFVLTLSYLSWNIFFQFVLEYMVEGNFNTKSPRNCSWTAVGNVWNSTQEIRFAYALDRAVGMLRNNININLTQQNGCSEVFYVVSWLIAKLLIYHCALKFIIFLLGSQSAKGKYFIMTKQVETFMNQRKFPPRIKKKILKFYAIRFQSSYFSESRMLASVTGQLREDILMHTGRQLVRELEFLKQLPRSLLLQIGLKLRIVVFIAGDIIFKINTIGECLYFIDKGTVAIYSESGNEICHLEDGDYFGEIALVMKHPFRTASAVAVTNCELFRLDKEDFDSSIACYPTVYEDIKKVAVSRFERTCVLDEHHKTELKMEEDYKKKGFSDLVLGGDNTE